MVEKKQDLASKLGISAVKAYQTTAHPVYHFLDKLGIKPVICKFEPTCSRYAIESIEKYGFFKGSCKAAYRILRCNPFNKGGHDPA